MSDVKRFVSINVTTTARDALRDATVEVTSAAGWRISMSDVLLGALDLAATHPAEFVDHLRARGGKTT